MSEGQGSETGGETKPRRASAEVVELREGGRLRSFPRARTALLVLGMHRSGTSAITRVLSLLGADLPRALMEPVAGDNPAGFWESRDIAALHDELLDSAGSSWDDVSPLPASWFSSDAAGGYEDRLLRLLERDFADSSLFVVKDPRIARLVPLWQSVLQRFSADPRYVLIVRNPLEVAASLKARNGFLPAKSYLLWLWHLLEAEACTRRRPRAFVLFDELLRDWQGTARRLERQLQISWPRRSATAGVEIDEFLTDRLRHHRAHAEELEARGDAVGWVKRAWPAVLDAVGGREGALAETLDSIRREAAAADVAFAPLVAQGRLRLARKEAEIRELGATLESQRGEHERLSTGLARRDRELATSAEEIRRLGGVLAERQAEVERLAAELEGGRREIERRGAALDRQRAEIERLAAELEGGRREIERRGAALTEQRAELERVAAELSRRDDELEGGRREIERRGAALDQQQAEIERLAAELARRDGELEKSGQEIERLNGALSERQEEVQRLDGALSERQDEIGRLDGEVAERDRQLTARGAELQRLEDELAGRDGELSQLGAKLAHHERVVEVFRRLGREREDRISAQEGELELLRAGQEARRGELRILEAEVRTQQTLLTLRADEIFRLRDELSGSHAELAELREGQAGLAANLSLLSERLRELDRQAEARNEELAAREGEIQRLGEEAGEAGRETERLRRELGEREAAAESLGDRLERSEGETAELSGALRGARGSIRQLERRLATEEGRVQGFLRSRSWRFTRPLRRLAAALRPSDRRSRRRRRRFEASGAAALFDEAFYRDQFADPLEVGPDAVLHYLDRGHREGRDPHPLFDTAFYLQGGREAERGATDALTHYCESGGAAGRDPHPLFRTVFYLEQLPAAAAAGNNPLLHYLRVGAAEGLTPHPLFDPAFYRDRNPDVAADGVDPLGHYVRYGGAEGRDPHPLFDARFYLEQNPQVERAGEDPLRHYLRSGAAQGRDPHPRFDSAFYQATNEDQASSGLTPLEHYLAVGAARGARTRGEVELSVLIIDHKIPMPDQDAGSLRMSNLISVLQTLACRVTFLPHNLFAAEPYTEQLHERGVATLTRPEAESIPGYLEAHGDDHDLVVVCRVTIADDCMEAVRALCPRAKIVFDTIDLQHLRMSRQAELEDDPELHAKAAEVKRRELELARIADATWVVSPYERELLLGEAPDLKVGLVSTIHDVHRRTGGFAERRDLLFIGGYEHPPNVDAVEWLVEEILPLVHREEPELRAFLIGSKPPERVRRLASKRVTVTGYVPDVEPYFSRCRLSVAPLRYGAGIKGKVNHSLALGVPCVLTGIAAEGMGLVHGVDAMIADDAPGLADCILALYRDPELWQRLSDGGQENVRGRFSFAVARQAVADSLVELDPLWERDPPSAP